MLCYYEAPKGNVMPLCWRRLRRVTFVAWLRAANTAKGAYVRRCCALRALPVLSDISLRRNGSRASHQKPCCGFCTTCFGSGAFCTTCVGTFWTTCFGAVCTTCFGVVTTCFGVVCTTCF